MEEKKYVCAGECGGVSDTPGVCQDPHCSKHGQPLIETVVENDDGGSDTEESEG